MENKLLSTIEVARILGISRIAVFHKIRTGSLKAEKVGRNYVVRDEDVREILGKTIGVEKKQAIDRAVSKAVREYREVFERLGKE